MHGPTGVIEGFYGPPWTAAARLRCIEHLAEWGMSYYVWAAKAEPRHRDRWDEAFTQDELVHFAQLATHRAGVSLAVALTPGPDADAATVVAKLAPAVDSGATALVLSFDDLPALGAGTRHREFAVAVLRELDVPVWLVPTHYAGGERSPYLDELHAGLPSEVEVMWTGPSVVADSITAADARARRDATDGRPPLLWDNTPVNDAMMTDRLHVGPLEGRDPGLLDELSGVLWNPMAQAEASLLTLVSCAAWLHGDDPGAAWQREIVRRGVGAFVEGVLGRAPSDRAALRAWLVEVSTCEVGDLGDDVLPWRDAARAEAALGLVALDLADLAGGDDPDPFSVTVGVVRLSAWRRVRSARHSVFGGRLAVRPVVDQDHLGRFRVLPGMVMEADTLVDELVREALAAAGALG